MDTPLAEQSFVDNQSTFAIRELISAFGENSFMEQECADGVVTIWIRRDMIIAVMKFLRSRFCMLYDLFGIDERTRIHRLGQPDQPADKTNSQNFWAGDMAFQEAMSRATALFVLRYNLVGT